MRLWNLLETFVERCQAAQTEQELADLLHDVVRELGFCYFALVHTLAFHHPAPHLIKLIHYPTWWMEYFEAEGLYHDDPMLSASHSAPRPFGWHEVWNYIDPEPRFLRILAMADGQGIGTGFTTPIRIPGEPNGSCSFATRPGVQLPFRCLQCAGIIGGFAFERARILRGCPVKPLRVPHLSPRQLDCLNLLVKGHGAKSIARELGLGIDTVNGYLKALRLIFGVSTKGEIMLRALRLGIVGYNDAIPPSG